MPLADNLQLKIYFRSYPPGTKIPSALNLVHCSLHVGIGFGKSDVDGALDGNLDVSMSAQPGYQFASVHLSGMPYLYLVSVRHLR